MTNPNDAYSRPGAEPATTTPADGGGELAGTGPGAGPIPPQTGAPDTLDTTAELEGNTATDSAAVSRGGLQEPVG